MYDTIQRLKELLVTRLKLKVGVDKIKDDTPLFGPNSLGLDSIDVLEMIIVIKKEFGVEIMDRETSENIFTSVGSIARYIEENR
ncbi:MAG: Acyl carrier protein (ACP1) [Candidatus Jettenia ecosi]|uniref:Acyl carrier protein (ACP1) n=1 Tax=Candidatus Jettenia ecosi TaxID=2494326 RepID=A0A533QGD8_9BACT|nr:MAG: Acyl carrier protein (ACP1) [Candidatus Jettenia ecosi]